MIKTEITFSLPDGTVLNEHQISEISEYYEAACTASILRNRFCIEPETALNLGYEARTRMDKYGLSEEEAVDDIGAGLLSVTVPREDAASDVDSFECDPNLEQYIDSMLFSSGRTIARLVLDREKETVYATLEIRGDVRVEYKGNVYTDPAEFPDELRDQILLHPGTWSIEAPDGDDPMEENRTLRVIDGNWFEYMITAVDKETERGFTNGVVMDNDFSLYTVEGLYTEMYNLVKEHTKKETK